VTREETLQPIPRPRLASARVDASVAGEALRPGVLLDGRYLMQAVLDEGGTSSVWRAEHVRIGRAVAVKVLRPEVARSATDVERFRREAQIAVRLSSPHVVDVLDFGDTPDGGLYLVMELLAGESLRELLRREERLAPARAAELLRQLLVGLEAAHRAGIVHRDLKPDNLWLVPLPDGGERLKILDFGIAKLEGPASGTESTRGGPVVGTPQFLSPEQAIGGDVDHRADLYSAGIVAWLLVTGCHPFSTLDPRTLLRAHAFDPVPSPTREVPSLAEHPALLRFIARATEKDRDRRAQSAAELLEVLAGRAPPSARSWPGSSGARAAPTGNPLLAPLATLRTLPAAFHSALRRPTAGPARAGVVLALAAAAALAWAMLRPPPAWLIASGRLADAEDRIAALAARRGPSDPEVLYLGGLLDAAHAERGAMERLPNAFIAWSRAVAAGSGDALVVLGREASSPRCDRRRLAARALGDAGVPATLTALRELAESEPAVPERSGALARVMRDLDWRCGAGDLARRAIRDIEAAGAR
jgi:tRNA A-37 threonylcarbamoyl transferase component Bud32